MSGLCMPRRTRRQAERGPPRRCGGTVRCGFFAHRVIISFDPACPAVLLFLFCMEGGVPHAIARPF